MKAELVFNFDEVDMSEWDDRKEKKVIVQATTDSRTIYHCASRSVRHISIIKCITIAEEPFTPYIVTSQDSDAIRRRLVSRDVCLGVDFVLRHLSKPCVNGEFFLEYINTIFVPYLNELQDLEDLETCEAVLLMDNWSPHVSDDIVAVPTRLRVRIIRFAIHTTHIFQVLDVVLFSALQKHATSLRTIEKQQ
jgi:hypothetical protein